MILCVNYACDWCCKPEILPITPAFCSMLLNAQYAPNYVSIINSSLNSNIHLKFAKVLEQRSLGYKLRLHSGNGHHQYA